MNDEWGPWIEHDGLTPPLVQIAAGDTVNIVGMSFDGKPHDAVGTWEPHHAHFPQWVWKLHGPLIGQIHRYRIRKPSALLDLIEMVENLPTEKERERETA